MDIFLLDNSNNIINEMTDIKPINYKDLLIQLENKFKILPENYSFFSFLNNKQIFIKNDEDLKSMKDILFLSELNKVNLGQLVFSENYNQLSESMQDILDDKYNCNICSNSNKMKSIIFAIYVKKYFIINVCKIGIYNIKGKMRI